MALVKLYIAGAQLGDTLLRNTVIDKLIKLNQLTGLGIGLEPIQLAYHKLPESSKLLALILDRFRRDDNLHWLKQHRAFLPPVFFVDLAFYLKTPEGQQQYMPPPCFFHDHDAEVPTCVGPR